MYYKIKSLKFIEIRVCGLNNVSEYLVKSTLPRTLKIVDFKFRCSDLGFCSEPLKNVETVICLGDDVADLQYLLKIESALKSQWRNIWSCLVFLENR